MIRPFEQVEAGQPISASEYNRAMQEIERQQRFNVGGSMTLTSDHTGNRLDMDSHPHIWVRITGHDTGYTSSGVLDMSKYSGIEQTDDPSTAGSYDLAGGLEFTVDGLYLKEVNGRTDVPENAIVRAYQSVNGSYFTFLFEQAFSDGSSGQHSGSCPVWSCPADFGPSGFSFGSCDSEFWSYDGVNPTPRAPYDWCGCVNGTDTICWPAWGNTDLQSTGISTACLLACESGQIVPRRACLNVVPGGPFGLRLALISVDDGHELHTPTDF